MILGITKTLFDLEEFKKAKNCFKNFLVYETTNDDYKPILRPSKLDQRQFNSVLQKITEKEKFKELLGGQTVAPFKTSSADKKIGRITKNFRIICKELKKHAERHGTARIEDISNTILNQMCVIQISITDPASGPKIFNNLNSKQVPVSIGDLVRNEVFSRIASEEPETLDRLDNEYWQPFHRKFQRDDQDFFDQYFFPYGLIENPNIKKSEVFNELRSKWNPPKKKPKDPETIIAELSRYQDAFIDLRCGTNLQEQEPSIANLIANAHLSNSPNSAYPFLMQVSNAVRDNLISLTEGEKIFAVIESFLIRRATCGYEPTGLHAVFKSLWKDCDGAPNLEKVTGCIKKRTTVKWPNNQEFKNDIEKRPLYDARITKYLILEYNKSRGGDQPENDFWIEHILPQTPTKEWKSLFTGTEIDSMLHRLANLLPLTKEMNRDVSNSPYKNKRSIFKADSIFKSTREFANKTTSWTPDALTKRGKKLANWAVKRWPY